MTIEVTVQDIRDRFTEFSDVNNFTDSFIQCNIDDALDDMDMYSALPTSKATILAKLLTAHYIIYDERSKLGDYDNVSPISSKSLGAASTSYEGSDAASELEASLNGTVYGQKFLMKLRQWQKVKVPWLNV